ncbi:MAG TPA: hypothetical protein VFR70_00035 [Flavobacterium sp.]|nr:hypothetical protein [Flavobacterium sp.]
MHEANEIPENLGEEQELISYASDRVEDSIFAVSPENVSPKDIFKLAKGILWASSIIFMLLALSRMMLPLWYEDSDEKLLEGVSEVWDFSKVALNSIVSLVLGLYFGSRSKSE